MDYKIKPRTVSPEMAELDRKARAKIEKKMGKPFTDCGWEQYKRLSRISRPKYS